MAQKSWKPTIIVVNKWDLAEGSDRAGRQTRHAGEIWGVSPQRNCGADLCSDRVCGSGDNHNVRETIELAFELQEQARSRITTGKLNRLLREIVTGGPTDTEGTHAKGGVLCRAGADRSADVTMVVNHPELFRPNYQRFLINRLRETPFVKCRCGWSCGHAASTGMIRA